MIDVVSVSSEHCNWSTNRRPLLGLAASDLGRRQAHSEVVGVAVGKVDRRRLPLVDKFDYYRAAASSFSRSLEVLMAAAAGSLVVDNTLI